MKKTFIICAMASLAMALTTAWAGTHGYTSYGKGGYGKGKAPVAPPAPVPCFQAGEFTLDLMSGYTWAQSSVGTNGDGWGAGIGGNYFVTEAFGLGTRWFIWDSDVGSPKHDISLSAIWRCTAWDSSCFAPYVIGGGGLNTNGSTNGTVHVGGGVDYRFAENLGLFTDARYTWVNDNNNYTMLNFGIRIKF